MTNRALFAFALLACSASAVLAFNPQQGDWGKTDPAHLRVMTYNVEDGICSTAVKTDGFNSWSALVRVVASMQPDVVMIQEAGDNSGNNTGSGVDSAAVLEQVFERFIHGGDDPWRGGQVTAFVQNFAPDYDLPFIRVSNATDGFNRNVILSRYPFADFNGDGGEAIDDIFIGSDVYAPGGTGGTRGFQYVEIDLPDDVYAGDAVIGNSHLKAFGSASDLQQRLEAAQNIAYYIDYYFNGAGTGVSDPNNRIFIPGSQGLLGENDIVIWGGDWNEDEDNNGRRGPADWMTKAAITGGTADGPDRDGTDATYDSSADPFTGNTDTRGGQKLDYIAWFDSIGTAVNQVVLYANTIPQSAFPAPMAMFGVPTFITDLASDHQPVFVDLELPAASTTPPCPADLNNDGEVGAGDLAILIGQWGDSDIGDIDGSGDTGPADLAALIGAWGPCPTR